MPGDVVDVERKLGPHVLMFTFGIVTLGPYLRASPGTTGHGRFTGLGMAEGVAQVVRERADGEGDIVGVLRVAEERADEVSRAHVVQQVRRRGLAEGVGAEVLDDAAAIGVGSCLAQLAGSEVGVTLEQEGPDGVGQVRSISSSWVRT